MQCVFSVEHDKSDMIIKWSKVGLTIFNMSELQDGLSQLEMVSYHSEYCSYDHVHGMSTLVKLKNIL